MAEIFPREHAYRSAALLGESDGVLMPDDSAPVRQAQAVVTCEVLRAAGCTKSEVLAALHRLHFPSANPKKKGTRLTTEEG